MNLVQAIKQIRTGFWQILSRCFKATPRQVTEFLLFSSIILTAAPSERSLIVGGIVSGIGVAIRLFASGYRYTEDSFKVRGPYRYVRHPHHLGSIIVGLGFAVVGQNIIVTLLSFASMALLFRSAINAEEQRLARSWGPRYAIFRANVSAIVPQVMPFVAAGGEGSKFSLRNVLVKDRHREINMILAVAAGYSCMYWASLLDERIFYVSIVGSSIVAFILFRGIYYGYAGNHRGTRGVVSIPEA